ncbi:hypothetical protein QVD17_03106 [Tagetes erecta]|uniref:Large ribosomal subunit protein bL33c n=1 Tax=Tagetes erecta TaxID=13708 RepID=A0AAD8L7S7_TARER|nr:hypothetical protein QVD17_03106 [Tagetes erecta]
MFQTSIIVYDLYEENDPGCIIRLKHLKKKSATMLIRLVSAAGTGFFYVKKKNPRKIQTKLEFRKYDPRVNRHVLFTEAKMK